ncbi:unnamed protein product [Rotaria sp. Silwood1]|nr:unnamed protein product [Rotaria sp. Silwood1]
MEEPTKSDIDAIFKRLRTIPANKMCFDCDSKNPTWASITYGVFLCIDCSARHRGLGVHLSFIRSTNLDTSWGWLQLRAMQVGGNANAEAFFQQHGCHTKDIQQKYNSRAAQLYREKLHQLATKTMKQYGTKLFLDDAHKNEHSQLTGEKKEGDFFHEHSQASAKTGWDDSVTVSSHSSNQSLDKTEQQTEGPSVDPSVLNNDGSVKTLDPKKTTIGQRRAPATKKKGFGAQKVATDFKEVERNVQEQEKLREQQAHLELKNREETEKQVEKQMANLKFVYQDMNKQRDFEEAKLKQSNPKKAEQMERLGMGFTNRSGVSHSAMTDMQTIQQEGVTTTRNVSLAPRNRDFFDDYESSGFSSRSNYDNFSSKNDDQYDESSEKLDDDLFKPKSSSKNTDTFNTDWEIVDRHTPTKDFGFSGTSSSSYSNNDAPNSSSKSKNQSSTSYNEGNNSETQKRFSNAKAISSDQFFNKNSDNQNNVVSRFQGSTSISSEDFFDDPNKRKQDRSIYQGPDLSAMTADFKEGVSKAANKLSSLASNVMSSIQKQMKYTIIRQFSLRKEKFEIIGGTKPVCTVKATPSKDRKGQYNIRSFSSVILSSPLSRHVDDEFCVIEPDSNIPRNYLIYIVNNESNEKTLFGQLSYEFCSPNNCLYTIVIGRKLYKVRSSDLKNRRLAIIDSLEQNNPSKLDQYPTFQCPQTLFQVIDTFSKSNKTYHVTINDKEKHLGYLSIVILLDLHECKLD